MNLRLDHKYRKLFIVIAFLCIYLPLINWGMRAMFVILFPFVLARLLYQLFADRSKNIAPFVCIAFVIVWLILIFFLIAIEWDYVSNYLMKNENSTLAGYMLSWAHPLGEPEDKELSELAISILFLFNACITFSMFLFLFSKLQKKHK